MNFSRYAPALAIGAMLLSMRPDVTSAQQAQSSTPQDTQAIIQAIISTPAQPASEAPKSGTFYSAQFGDKWPPLPADILNLPFWDLGEGFFIYNDTNIDYSTLQQETTKEASRSVTGPEMMVKTTRGVKTSSTLDSPPSPPGGGDGGGGGGGGGPLIPDYASNALWLEILQPGTNAFNKDTNSATVLLHGTVPEMAYILFSDTNLNSATTGTVWTAWTIEQNLIGAENTNVTPTTVSMIGRPMLYLRALAFTLDSDLDGLPDWWESRYSTSAFPLSPTNADTGNTGIPDGYKMDSAGDGWNNLQKYQMGIPPNVWATPPPPTGLTVMTTNSGTNASLSWNASPGPVLNYNIYKDGVLLTNVSASQTSFMDTSYQPGDSYQLQADYSGGNSALGAADNPAIVPEYTTDAYIVRGPQGRLFLAASAVPPNVSSIRIGVGVNPSGISLSAGAAYPLPYTFSSFWQASQDFGDFFTNIFDVPVTSLINGIYEIPTGDVPAFYGAFFYTQAVGTDGRLGNPSEEQYLSNWNSGNVPFLDGTTQIQQNVSFLLRAATQSQPFSFYYQAPGYSPVYLDPQRTNYVFAGFHGFQDLNFSALQMNEFEPFEENYFYRNFAYQPNPNDTYGNLLTGAYSGYTYGLGVDVPMFLFPTYSYVVSSNQASIPAILPGATTAKWLFYAYLYGATNGADIGLFPDSNPVLADVASRFQNLFGLSLKSVEYPSSSTDVNAFTTAFAGSSITNDYTGNYFFEMDQPVLTTVAYYFARPGIDPLPGEDAFSNTNATASPIIIPFGKPFQITAWTKQAISNGYSGKFAYAEQYFDQAYEIDTNGVVTTNTTGILSPYGEFFPTEPGPTALVTMPDGATGLRGTGIVNVIKMQLDVNHDSTMDLSFGGPDNTTSARPYEFWVNNNFDRGHSVDLATDYEIDDLLSADSPGHPGISTPDCDYTLGPGSPYYIPSTKDLEDYARLWIPGLIDLIGAHTNVDVQISIRNGDSGNGPAINLYTAYEAGGGTQYLTNSTIATRQIEQDLPCIGRIQPGSSISLKNFLSSWHAAYQDFIWCGARPGAGELVLQVLSGTNLIGETSTWINLKDIKQMYERYTVGDSPYMHPMDTPLLAGEGLPFPFQYRAPGNTNTPYILFVHGWNMIDWAKDKFAETAFRRIYWQGYQGRFGLFRWPTLYAFPFGEDNGSTGQSYDLQSFDTSELYSWEAGAPLRKLLVQLNSEYSGQLYMFAHSHGNIAAAEALRTNVMLVKTYVAMQAAVPSHAYDPTATNRSLGVLGIYDSGTPERTAQYWTNGAPCYLNYISGAGTFADFYNPVDWALSIWEFDQDLKPDAGFNWSPGNGGALETYFETLNENILTLKFPTNTFTIFSYITEARCYAVGEQADLGGVFNKSKQNNLTSAPFYLDDTHKSHSGEFRNNNMARGPIWDKMLQVMGLKPDDGL